MVRSFSCLGKKRKGEDVSSMFFAVAAGLYMYAIIQYILWWRERGFEADGERNGRGCWGLEMEEEKEEMLAHISRVKALWATEVYNISWWCLLPTENAMEEVVLVPNDGMESLHFRIGAHWLWNLVPDHFKLHNSMIPWKIELPFQGIVTCLIFVAIYDKYPWFNCLPAWVVFLASLFLWTSYVIPKDFSDPSNIFKHTISLTMQKRNQKGSKRINVTCKVN